MAGTRKGVSSLSELSCGDFRHPHATGDPVPPWKPFGETNDIASGLQHEFAAICCSRLVDRDICLQHPDRRCCLQQAVRDDMTIHEAAGASTQVICPGQHRISDVSPGHQTRIFHFYTLGLYSPLHSFRLSSKFSRSYAHDHDDHDDTMRSFAARGKCIWGNLRE